MSIIEKKEKNLNQLINKLNSLTLTYSQPKYEVEKIKNEKNEILRQKHEIEFHSEKESIKLESNSDNFVDSFELTINTIKGTQKIKAEN